VCVFVYLFCVIFFFLSTGVLMFAFHIQPHVPLAHEKQ
jgi:hypothetical protein